MSPAPGRWQRAPIASAPQAIDIVVDVGRRHRFNGLPATRQIAEEAPRIAGIVPRGAAAVALCVHVLAKPREQDVVMGLGLRHDDLHGVKHPKIVPQTSGNSLLAAEDNAKQNHLESPRNQRFATMLRITDSLSFKSALQLVDVRVLDHLVVGRGQVVSFAERGLL